MWGPGINLANSPCPEVPAPAPGRANCRAQGWNQQLPSPAAPDSGAGAGAGVCHGSSQKSTTSCNKQPSKPISTADVVMGFMGLFLIMHLEKD